MSTVEAFDIDADGCRLSALRSRNGGDVAVVFVHGNSSSAATFSSLLRTAALPDTTLIALSLPGHGESARRADPTQYRLPALRRTLREALHMLRARTTIACGHSLGGHLLLELLPEQLDLNAILLVSSPPLAQETLASTFKPDPTDGALFAGELDTRQTKSFEASLAPPGRIEASIVDAVARSIQATDPAFRVALGQSVAALEFGDEAENLRQTRLPVAIVGGLADPFIAAEAYANLSAPNLWRGRPLLFPRVGHCPHLEAPYDFQELLRDFSSDIREHSAGAARQG